MKHWYGNYAPQCPVSALGPNSIQPLRIPRRMSSPPIPLKKCGPRGRRRWGAVHPAGHLPQGIRRMMSNRRASGVGAHYCASASKALPETGRARRRATLSANWVSSTMRHHSNNRFRLTPILRAAIEIAFIVFLFYSNLLMGEFTVTNGHGKSLAFALDDILTGTNFIIATISALIGYVVFEYLRKRL